MATKFTAGTVINAGLIVVGVDADAPPATPSPAPEPAPESAPEPITINNSRLVSLLLDASVDADGSVVDGSTNSHAITVNGDVTQSSFSPYRSGGYSWEFDGSGDYLTVGDANLLDITSATQSFTVEAWVNPASRSVGGAGYRFSSIVSKGVVYVSFGITDTGALQFYTYNGGFNYITSTAGDIALNEWQHVAVVCDSGSITLYKNGTSIATGSLVVPTGGTNVVPKIGAADPAYASDFFDGKMADLRIMDGTVTAPTAAPTERLTEVAGTSLLTCNLPYLQSGLTAHGDVSPVAAGPYDYAGYSESLHGGSIVFGNADGNSLSMTGSADFQLDADFTLESWVNITDNGKWQPLAMWGNGHYKAIRIAGRNTSITEINIEYPNSYVFVTHPTPVHGTGWHHIAIVRSGSTITLYVDGVAGNTVTLSNTIGTTEDFKVGYHTTGGGNHWVDGSFADYRLVKGTAVYTEDFTPPTAPLEAVTGTSLLLSGNNAAIRDESQSVESISVFGNTTVADSSPYGTGKSMSFDGNGDYLSIDLGDNLIDSNTPFTVEFWMYPENISNRGILHFTNNPGTLEATLYISGAGNLSWFDSRVGSAAAGDITPNSGGGITTNEWHHIALTRQSDNYVKIYVDGQLYNVSSSVWDLGLSRYLEVGRYANTAYFDGYVSDLRIIEGTAIYTENFSVPTAPLGDYSESTPSPAPEPEPAPEPSASWIVVGTYGDDDGGANSGSVYVYDATDLTSQPTKLLPSDIAANDFFGHDVASTANMIVVGSLNDDDGGSNTGSAYVYDANDLTAQPTKLTAFDAVSGDKFGEYVAISDDKVIIGAQRANSSAGAVYVYDANDLTAQPTKLTAFDGNTSDNFGGAIAVSSTKIVVGSRKDSHNGMTHAGSAYVFDINDLSAQPTKLTAFDAVASSYFGNAVDISDDKIVVAAYTDEENGDDSGSVYVYNANDLSEQPVKLTAFDGAAFDSFGQSVSISENKLVVGTYADDDDGVNSGSAYVFDINDLSAQPTKLTAPDAAARDTFGRSVSISGDKIFVSGDQNDDPENSGSVYVYDATDLTAEPTKLTAFDAAEGDRFGHVVAIG